MRPRNGLERLAECSAEHAEYFPSNEFEEGEVADLISEYDDDQFWEELPDRLAMRDFSREYDEQAAAALDSKDFAAKSQPFLDKYWDEVEKHGIDRLEIAGGDAPKR